MHDIYLIRHGETTVARKGLIAGASDVPLSRFGILQMQSVAKWLEDKPLEMIYSSSLRRAAEPAAELAAARKLPHSEVMDFCEIDFGDWEGKTWEALAAADPDAVARAKSGSPFFTFPNGEGADYFPRRVQTAFAYVVGRSAGPAAIFLHGGTARMILAGVLGMSLAEALKLEIAPGSISVLAPRGNAHEVSTINMVSHLPAMDG